MPISLTSMSIVHFLQTKLEILEINLLMQASRSTTVKGEYLERLVIWWHTPTSHGPLLEIDKLLNLCLLKLNWKEPIKEIFPTNLTYFLASFIHPSLVPNLCYPFELVDHQLGFLLQRNTHDHYHLVGLFNEPNRVFLHLGTMKLQRIYLYEVMRSNGQSSHLGSNDCLSIGLLANAWTNNVKAA